MSRPALAATCAAVLLAGFVAGRVTSSGSTRTLTVHETVEHVVVVGAKHLGSAGDPRDRGPIDLARVESVRRGDLLRTTIAAREPWRDALLRRVSISVLYDANEDGRTDRRDVVSLFRGRPMSWISSLGQGAQAAAVTRPRATTISIDRDARILFNASGQAHLLATSPIGVAVVARWSGGVDRVPDRGWITVPPPPGGAASSSLGP